MGCSESTNRKSDELEPLSAIERKGESNNGQKRKERKRGAARKQVRAYVDVFLLQDPRFRC